MRGRLLSHDDCQTLKSATTRYAATAVLAFAKEVCDLARTGFPHVDRLRSIVDARVETVIHHAYFRLGLDDYLKEVWRTDYECQREVSAEIKRSAGWFAFLSDFAAATANGPLPATEASARSTNAQRIDAYIAEVRHRTDRKKFGRIDIWQDEGYADGTEFERWQRDDPKTTYTARRRFERVLATKPHLKGSSKP